MKIREEADRLTKRLHDIDPDNWDLMNDAIDGATGGELDFIQLDIMHREVAKRIRKIKIDTLLGRTGARP